MEENEGSMVFNANVSTNYGMGLNQVNYSNNKSLNKAQSDNNIFNFNNSKEHKNEEIHTDEHKEEKHGFKPLVAATTALGTLGAMLITKKFQPGTKLFGLKYGLKEILAVGSGSIIGGFTGGVIQDKGKNTWDKVKKANHSFIASLIAPSILIDGFLKIADKVPGKYGKVAKAAAVGGGLIGGIQIGSKVANKINNDVIKKGHKVEIHPTIKDTLVHVDDFPKAFALADVPLIAKILPFALMIHGYEAGAGHNH